MSGSNRKQNLLGNIHDPSYPSQWHLKENQKKTLDKFEIISKLETIKAQLNTIKNQL